jgi:hypothetical protein
MLHLRAYPIDKENRHTLNIPTFKLWSGDEPSVADLVAQIKEPMQLRVLAYHTRATSFKLPIDDKSAAVNPGFVRVDMTDRTMADLANIPRSKLRDAKNRASRRAKKLAKRAKAIGYGS